MELLADKGNSDIEGAMTELMQTNAGREEKEGEQQPLIQDAPPRPEVTEAQQRERHKADIRAHNANVSFTKIYLDDKALLRGFRVRPWVVQMLLQLVDNVIEQCEKVQDNGEGETEGNEDEQEVEVRGEKDDNNGHEDELDAAVRAEAAEMAQTMQAMGWEVPLSFGGGDGGPGRRWKGSRKRQRNAFTGATASSHKNKHIRFGDDRKDIAAAAALSPWSSSSTLFPADGKDEAPTASFPLPPFPFSSSSAKAAPPDAPPPQKYWMQRFRFFSQFDLGCRLDEEGWFSITPERIAHHIAERCRCNVVVDLFIGCGGNAIQFALTSHHVLAIDLDPTKLALARHNARIYGVADRIEFILGDALTLLPRLGSLANILFLSPPWGGPEYASTPTYSLNQIQLKGGVGGKEMMRRVLEVCPNVCVLLPRNVDLRELAEVGGGRKCEVEENVLNFKMKTITVYYGEWFLPAPMSDWTVKKQWQQQQLQQQQQPGGGGGRRGGKKKRNRRQRMKDRAEREMREGGEEEAVGAMWVV